MNKTDDQGDRYFYWVFSILSILYIFSPLTRTLLGLMIVYTHELGHGLAATFWADQGYVEKIVFDDSLSGSAHSIYSKNDGIGRAAIYAGGFLAPSVIGFVFLLFRHNNALVHSLLLMAMITVLFLSFFWVGNLFGRGFVAACITVLVLIIYLNKLALVKVTILSLGLLLAYIGMIHQLGYLYITQFVRNGTTMLSDSYRLAQSLDTDHVVVSTLILATQLLLLFLGLYAGKAAKQ